MNASQEPSRILIIDDTPANLGVVVEALEREGHRVLVAQDGKEGIERANLVHPDIILLDVMMPGDNGFEVCQKLKAQPRTQDTPVIFMTALSDMNDKVKGFQAGGVDYITKPFQLEEVLARVATHLELRRMQQRLSAQNAELQIYRDSLEQQVAERTAALRESAERLQMKTHVLNRVHEAVYLMDEDGNFHYVNEEACRQLGYGADELLRMSVADIDPGWPRPRIRKTFGALRKLRRGQFESVHHGRDGRAFPVEITVSLVEYDGKEYALALTRDITARKQAEQALHTSEQAFRAVVENTPDIIVRYDTQCRRVYMNPAIVALFGGHPAEQLLGRIPGEHSPVVDRPAYQDVIERVIACGEAREQEALYCLPTGEARWAHMRFVPERNPDGEVVSVLAIGRDIDDLKKNEQRFRTLAENFPDFLIRLDGDCRLLYVNPPVEKAVGIPAEDFVGKRLGDLLPGPPEQTGQLEAGVRLAFATGVPNYHEARWQTDRGEAIFEIRHVPECDSNGHVVNVLGIGRNVSRLRAAEEALRTSEREFRTLAENIPDQIIRYDANGRKTYLNSAAARQMGTSAASLIGLTPEETPAGMRAMSGDEIGRLLRKVLQTGEPQHVELPVRHAEEGDRIHHLRFSAERDDEGRIVGALMVGRDITERIESERRLAESYALLQELTTQREAAREDERKRIAREIHDELGQHLTTLRMGISAMRFQFGEENPALLANLQEMMDLADKTIKVVRNVATALRPAALDAGIGSALEWLASAFEGNCGIRCKVHLPPVDIDLDESRAMALFRIVQESLTNVARHSRADTVEIRMTSGECGCAIEIRDDGCGFDDTGIRRDSFGLVGMRERALMLGGTVSVESRPGDGTTIKVTIPLHDEEES